LCIPREEALSYRIPDDHTHPYGQDQTCATSVVVASLFRIRCHFMTTIPRMGSHLVIFLKFSLRPGHQHNQGNFADGPLLPIRWATPLREDSRNSSFLTANIWLRQVFKQEE